MEVSEFTLKSEKRKTKKMVSKMGGDVSFDGFGIWATFGGAWNFLGG